MAFHTRLANAPFSIVLRTIMVVVGYPVKDKNFPVSCLLISESGLSQMGIHSGGNDGRL